MDKETVLKIKNMHTEACGVAPANSNECANQYTGYFENELGEQWVFVFDRETKIGELRGGDAGWEKCFRMIDGKIDGLVLSDPERMWLASCWAAAIGQS